jgi:hypothetical protein
VTLLIEPHQALEVRQHRQRAATFGGRDPRRRLTHAIVVEAAVHEAEPQ